MRLLLLSTGRRSKLLVALVGILFAAGLASQSGKLEQVQKSDTADFLPGGAESVAALEAARQFPSGDVSPAVVVAARDGGLTGADRAALSRGRAAAADGSLPLAVDRLPPVTFARDGAAALLPVPLRAGDGDAVAEAVKELRAALTDAPPGLETAVTGPAGFTTDLKDVFAGADTRLLAVTGGLVLVLLILIYRSPIFWLVPFFTVLLTEGASRGMAALLGEAGLTINGQNAGILSVLVFGAATDYALLLVARYREELRREEDAGRAMAAALRGAAPAILASGGTVIAGLLTLVLADVDSTASIGPLGAVGVALALLLSLTVLPATLVLVGRRAFWPYVPRVVAASAPGAATPRDPADDPREHRIWHALGRRIEAHPRRLWLGATAILAVLALGLTGIDTSLTQEQQLRGNPEAVTGQALLAEHFPAGSSAPASVIVPPGGDVEAVRAAVERSDAAAGIQRTEEGRPGTQLSVVLASDPFSERAVAAIPRLRAAVHAVAPEALIGGQTAQSYDLRQAAERDNLAIPPLTLLVVLLILIALLRAVVAPLLLLAATALSAAAALGAGVVIFGHVLDLPAVDPALPLLAFVFLVALGIDYTIFLMARAREEAARRGTRRGVLAALAVTGGVITSAGVVLAGTFSALAVLPLVLLTELGTVVAFGVLLDTLLVRSVLVPALVHDVGERVWWPSRPARDDGDVR
ncbi:MMPL family transporter [Conexibacter sp. JD483]|uniref:MMPL family transporter n=1 Tax=unclassified Conexibacter TaxID=2627773 RepID=UPI002723DFD9|nr:MULTISPECIES: MMPL family transporter [unclassified Conexibacter]MDO8189023.1 MMPL family transporter [Conexibacter sp. CPCC 205706]MDO8201423.1 MMPL family transporter [Conexibacter sp. CPCC 205762]MDR9371690.1 MMPL family transporter [Conexibacter sp. JD483]